MLNKYIPLILMTTSVLAACASSTNPHYVDEQGLWQYKSRCDAEFKQNAQNETKKDIPIPLRRVPPKFPLLAVKRKVTGFVRVEYDISEEGKPVNINIISAYPNNIFNSVAVKNVATWQFEPKAVTCLRSQIDFDVN